MSKNLILVIKKLLILFSVCAFLSVHADNEKSVSINTKPESLLERIVDSYVNSSMTNETLKHLLDAKMYLSTAEHDLLVSHDKESAKIDINNSIAYLKDAEKTAQAETKVKIVRLVQKLEFLDKKVAQEKITDQDSKMDELLITAQNNLISAKSSEDASLESKQHLDEIINKIQSLRDKVEYANLRDDYESAMIFLSQIIHGL